MEDYIFLLIILDMGIKQKGSTRSKQHNIVTVTEDVVKKKYIYYYTCYIWTWKTTKAISCDKLYLDMILDSDHPYY